MLRSLNTEGKYQMKNKNSFPSITYLFLLPFAVVFGVTGQHQCYLTTYFVVA